MNVIMTYSWWNIISAVLINIGFLRMILLAYINSPVSDKVFFMPSFWMILAGVICYAIDRAVGGDWDDVIP